MMESTDNVKDEMMALKCFVCSRGLQQGDLAFCLFSHRYRADGVQDTPISEVLSSILSLDILDSNTQSKIICDECNDRLNKYEELEQQMLEIKYKIIQDFSVASRSGENDNEAHFEIEEAFEEGIEEEPHDEEPLSNDAECIEPDVKPPTSNEEASNAELLSLLSEHKDISASLHQQERIAQTIIVKQENLDSELETGEYFDQNTGNIVEILADDNVEYSNAVEDETKADDKMEDETPLVEDETPLVDDETPLVEDDGTGDESQDTDHDGQAFFYFNGLKYICLICSAEAPGDEANEFDDADALSKHLNESHGVPGFFCKICGDEFEKQDDLNEHCRIKHDEVLEDRKMNNDKEFTVDRKSYYSFNGENFSCLLCPAGSEEATVLHVLRTMTAHFRAVHNLRVYICDICGTDFKKRMELTEHVDEVHGGTEDGEFQCETCQRIFTNLRQFRIHKRLHYNMNKTYQCPQCDKKYNSKNLLDEHMNMHTGERPYKCQQCTKDFASKYTLTAHMKIHMDRPRPFNCKECGKSFFSAQNLLQHEKIHSGVKEFVCGVCDKAFGTQHNLEVHKIVHTGYKPFICRTCGKAFARRAEIKDHERTHTGERPFVCDICNMSFAQRSNLTTHKRATHLNDKRYKCEQCDRSFKRRRLLDYHIRASHTGERPYVCMLCNATFVYPEHYKKHLRIHTGVKPYSCEVCGKSFNSRDNRNAHRFVHSDKKPYECLVCGQGFMRKPLLYTHMQQSGHVNDTIIINQPRIMDGDSKKSGDEKVLIEMADGLVEEQMDEQNQYATSADEDLVAVIDDGEDNSLSNEMLEDDFNEVMDTYVVRYEDEAEQMQFVQIS